MTDITGATSRAKHDAVVRAYNAAYQALYGAGMTLLSSDAVLLADFVKAGGAFHGPQVETATISVKEFVPFLRKLRAELDAANAEISALQKDIASSLRASMLATVDRVKAQNQAERFSAALLEVKGTIGTAPATGLAHIRLRNAENALQRCYMAADTALRRE
jgi:hypothetical protein